MTNRREALGEIIRNRRRTIPLTLRELAALAGVSVSHLARVESGQRFPSAGILRNIARPLGFTEQELLVLAGYMSSEVGMLKEAGEEYAIGRLDMRVAKALAQEPLEVQRAVLKMLPLLKSIAKEIAQSEVGQRVFTLEELAMYNGNSKPSYIAYASRVYDVSDSPAWVNGDHQGVHMAGGDMTPHMKDAPHGEEVLSRFPVVGKLVQSEQARHDSS